MMSKEPKGKSGNLQTVCSHYTYEGNVHLNKALNEIYLCNHVKPCQLCPKDSGIPENTGKKKRKKKPIEVWVCLTCRGHFCGSGNSHMRAHCQETEHWWGAKNNDPTSIYCFKCRRDVMVWFPEDDKKNDKKVARIDLSFAIAGLKTLGTQSSFNAILQNLLSLYPLRKEIIEAEFPRTARIAMALRELFVKTNKVMRQSLYGKTGPTVRTKSDEDVNTSTLLSHMYQIDPDFRSRDSEETFCCILRALHEDVKKAWAGAHEVVDSTLVDSVFGGECSITASCSECSDSSTEEERFFHLSLPFARSIGSEDHVSVEECLKLYTDPQLWFCKKCIKAGYDKDSHEDDKRAGTRRIWIIRPPQVLVLHFKRKESDDQSKKLEMRINPQDKLNIRPFMDPSCGMGGNISYRLVGVVQYDETSGHYANVKAIAIKTYLPDWFKAVDLQVDKTALKSVEGEPHLLFYRQVLDKSNPLQPEKSDKVIKEGGVVKKGKEPALLEQIVDKIPPLAEGSHPMESPEGHPNLPQLIEESRPIENLPLPVEGSPPRENLPVPFQGADPIEIRANVIMPLPNLGNTCYVNVVLQSLLSLDSLRSKMLGPNVPTGPLISSLKDLFIQTSPLCPAPVPLDPTNLLESMFELCPVLKRGREEDSHEFLSFFLDQLEIEEVNAQKPMDIDTIVNSLFRGSVSTTVSSMQCHHDSKTPAEKFLGMQFFTPKGSLKVSIEDLWGSYTAERKILVVKAPPVLVITIHNYEFISSETKKLEVDVDFKEMFDIRPFMKQGSVAINTLYQLTGVVQHTGDPKGRAHYTAYVRANKTRGLKQHSDTKSWFCASDRHIQEVCLDEVLGCEPYMLFYERCDADLTCEGSNLAINMQSPFSANPSGEEYHADSNRQPPTSTSVSGSSPAPQDGVRPWEYPKTRNLSQKKRNELDQVNDTVGQHVGNFLDQYILQGDTKPFYHYELVTMCERGAGSRKLNVDYSHLLHFSKGLAMDVCNGYRRLTFSLKEAAINFARKIAELAAAGHLVLSDSARKRLEQLGSDDMNSSLELRFLEMPKLHELLKHHLSGPLTQEMPVYGNYEIAIRTPLPIKCSLVQRLIADIISGHRVGLSWNGEFDLIDIELMDDRVFIAKKPKPFSIHPIISPEMVQAMGRDFFRLAKLVLRRFRYLRDAVLGNFRTTGAYIPYLETFYDLLTQMDKYAEWWSSNNKAEAMRHLIEHNPFLKPVLARSNLWSGMFSANRSHDTGDWSVLFKEVLETHGSARTWLSRLYHGGNRMVQCVIEHKDNSLVGTDPNATVPAAAEAVTTSAEAVPPAAAAETVPTPTEAAPPPTAETVPTPSEAAEPAPLPVAETYYRNTDEFLFEIMRHLAHHGSAHSFLRRGHGPRIQLMKSLEEPELAAVLYIEKELVQALAELLKTSAMTGLLKAVWECYKNCNHPRRQ